MDFELSHALPQLRRIHKHIQHVLPRQLPRHAQRLVQHVNGRAPLSLAVRAVDVGVVEEVNESEVCVESVDLAQEVDVRQAVGVLVEGLRPVAAAGPALCSAAVSD